MLLLLHLRRLALRVLDPSLAKHCAIVGVGASTCAAAGLLMMFLRLPGVVELVAAACAILFLLWSLYLLVRFAFAFARAHRAGAAAWA